MRVKSISRATFTLLLLVLAQYRSAAQPMPIRLLTEEWPPYNYTENGQLTGFATDIVASILEEFCMTCDITALPGVRAKQILDGEPRTAYFSMFRTPERESQYKWVGPLCADSFWFYKKKGSSLRIETLEDARNVGSVSCRNVGLVFSFLTDNGFTNLDTTTSPPGIYRKVVEGRCDLAIGEAPLGVAYWLKHEGFTPDSLERTPVHILDFDLYIAFSRDVPDEEIARWQEALDRMKADGEYDEIYRAYFENP